MAGTLRNAWCCAWAIFIRRPPLVRIHSECLTGDVFHSLRCDCRSQLELSLNLITEEGRGLLIYEHQEGRGIGLLNKLRAYELQDGGADTVEANERLGFEADLRHYEMPAEILRYFKVKSVRLLSNNPDKIAALEHAGIDVTERIPCIVAPHESTRRLSEDQEAEDGPSAGLSCTQFEAAPFETALGWDSALRRLSFPVLPHLRFSRTLKAWKYISRLSRKRGFPKSPPMQGPTSNDWYPRVEGMARACPSRT